MGSYLKHAGFIRYRGSSKVAKDQIIEEFCFEYNNYAFASLFYKESKTFVLQITTLEENHIARWRAYIDLSGRRLTAAAIMFCGGYANGHNSSCILKTSYDAMRSFWMSERTPYPKAWQIRRAMKSYFSFLKRIEVHVAQQMTSDGFGFAKKYRREGLHIYWLCKRANHSFVNQIDQVCPALLSILAYGLRKGYFTIEFVDSLMLQVKRGQSIKGVARRIFNYLMRNVLDIDLRIHNHWHELQRLPSCKIGESFDTWWKLLRLGTRGTQPSIHISAPLVYFPHELVPSNARERETFINRFCGLPFLRIRFPQLDGIDRNKELALLIFKNHQKLSESTNKSSIGLIGLYLLDKPNVMIDRNMNAEKTFRKWFSAFMAERQEEFAHRNVKKPESLCAFEKFAEPWSLVDNDIVIRNLNSPTKMTEYGKRMLNCLGRNDMIEAAADGKYIFCEASVGDLLLTVALTPIHDSQQSVRLGNVLGIKNQRVPMIVRDNIAKVLSKKFNLID